MITLFGLTFNVYAALLILFLLLVLYAIKRAQDDPESNFDWADLLTSTDQATGEQKASISKILQIVGGITGTFIVVKLTLQGNIEFDIFAAYLAYVASIEGFSKFMIAKYGAGQDRQNSYGYRPPRHYRSYDQDDYTPPPKPEQD